MPRLAKRADRTTKVIRSFARGVSAWREGERERIARNLEIARSLRERPMTRAEFRERLIRDLGLME